MISSITPRKKRYKYLLKIVKILLKIQVSLRAESYGSVEIKKQWVRICRVGATE